MSQTPAARTRTPPERIAVGLEQLEPLDWRRLFGNDRPIEVEIGTGKGGFLLARAREHPELNFFGIEWAGKYYRYAVDRMSRWGVTNVRLVRTDALHFFVVLCPPESVHVLHVYHPDPWPKKRHHKRRLFQPRFVEAAVRALVPGGVVRVQTDHAGYFDVIRGLLTGHPQLREVPFDDARFGIADDGRVETNFEIKYRREGRDIHRLAARKLPAPEPADG